MGMESILGSFDLLLMFSLLVQSKLDLYWTRLNLGNIIKFISAINLPFDLTQ